MEDIVLTRVCSEHSAKMAKRLKKAVLQLHILPEEL